MSSPTTRSGLLAGALGGALLLVVWLAVQAHTAVTYHRLTALSVLRDYAAFAAEQFTNRATQRLAVTGSDVLTALRDAGGADPQATPDLRQLPLSPSGALVLPYIAWTFRIALDAGDGAWVRRVGEDVSGVAQTAPTWLADTVRHHAATVYQKNWYLAAILVGDQVVMYAIRRSGGPPVAYGFVARTELFAAVFHQIEAGDPLLPPTLTGGERIDSIATVGVAGPGGGRVLYGPTSAYSSSLAGTASLPPLFGSLVVTLTLRPDIAPRLVIGGLPQSRLPLVLGPLALTILLVAVAVVQLRRERDLARRQTDFVASVSHELRTPLAQIRMFAETLRLGRVRSDEERDRSLGIVDAEARRLSHLVDNVLHMARAQRGDVASRLTPTDVPLAPALQEILDGFHPVAASRRARLTLEVDREPVAVVDRAALGQIVLNLLDNAVKYGPVGGKVTVRAHLVTEHGTWARVEVEDEGPGVPEVQRTQIWERFVRLDRDRESAVGGSGIGLAIVRELVDLQGGRVRVEHGAQERGARFVILLPEGRASRGEHRSSGDETTPRRRAG